jgi:lysophospholipase L1-like esterase
MAAKLILLGDSIFAGWRNGQMSPLLKDRLTGRLPRYDIVMAAVPGETTDEALNRVTQDTAAGEHDIVVIGYGANDASNTTNVTADDFYDNLRTMIEIIGPDAVILLTPPFGDPKRLQDRNQDSVAGYTQAAKEVADKESVLLVDLHQAMVTSPDPQALLASDGQHFTDLGYDLLADLIVSSVHAMENR